MQKYQQPHSAVDLIRQQQNQLEPEQTSNIQYFREIAVRNDVWLSLGGIQELRPDLQYNKISNAHVIIAPDGSIRAIYRKVYVAFYVISMFII